MSPTNWLRLGIIVTFTGLIAIAHVVLTNGGILPRRAGFAIGAVLIVLGVPLLAVGIRRRRANR